MISVNKSVFIISILFFSLIPVFNIYAVDLDRDGTPLAIQGYDPVAYHTENHATKGYPNLYVKQADVNWHFCNSDYKELFIKEKDKYMPAYAGYCAYTMSTKGYKKNSDPEIWEIVDGRLFLFANDDKKEKWDEDVVKNVEKADMNWEKLE